ncbi:MAG: serine/threonine protein phosphatase [Rhodobacteraceae bacterium]|nr:serine/threonine protein phosphatase [Paracoccaceae bacterium]
MSKTEEYRIYAIGDIHGCLAELENMQARIKADLAARPHLKPLVIYLGDYMDRGPDCRGVLENLMKANTSALPARFLYGNHDSYPKLFLNDPISLHGCRYHWLDPVMGGQITLESYGAWGAKPEKAEAFSDAFSDVYPQAHFDWIEGCERSIHIGGYFFAHAGVDPTRPLDQQLEYDLMWIRQPFLSFKEDLGAIVVHGHTPVDEVENHGNRIAVDTGAVFGRKLSCLVLENEVQELLLEPSGRAPCPVIAGA